MIKVRFVAIDDNKICLCKLANTNYYCLPGGTVEKGETLSQTAVRECVEELGFKPDLGGILYAQEFIDSARNEVIIEFWFEIKNIKDFYNVDLSKTTHGFELSEIGFFDLEKDDIKVLPIETRELVKKWISGDKKYINIRLEK